MENFTNMEDFTDQEVIDEMLRRFAVTQWFSKEHAEWRAKRPLDDDEWEEIRDKYHKDDGKHDGIYDRFAVCVCDWVDENDEESDDEESDDEKRCDEESDEEEEVKCSQCETPLDHFRDGTTEEGHRCNNCYWEDEAKTKKDFDAIITPDYRIKKKEKEK